MRQPLWKTVEQFLTKLNLLLPYNAVIMLLCVYSNELKMYVYKIICTQTFIAAMFVIAKTRKQPRCPSEAEQISCRPCRQHTLIQY